MLRKLKGLRLFLHEATKYGLTYAMDIRYFHQHYMTGKPERIERIYKEEAFPTYLEVEITTHCNLRCRICEHTYWNEKPQHMPIDKFKHIIDQFPKIRWIGLTGIGESFLHPDFLEIVNLVKARGAYLELYDTFYFMDENASRAMITAPCDRLLISLDAATAETYHKQRIGSNFEYVTTNLRRMFQLKKELRSEKPELEFHFIVNSLNIHEMIPFIHLAKDIIGDDSTKVVFTRMLHYYKETEDLFVEIPEDDKTKVLEEANRIGVPVFWNADCVKHKPKCSMCSAWTMPFIFVTGEVIPCCAANEANARQRQRELSMGNIFEQDMRSIWYGGKFTELRRTLSEGKFPMACRDCCIYEEGNHRPLSR